MIGSERTSKHKLVIEVKNIKVGKQVVQIDYVSSCSYVTRLCNFTLALGFATKSLFDEKISRTFPTSVNASSNFVYREF